ncbi:MAG: QueT transporter family protein [Lachnospiraceae bacterium]|nr:QueT transporter family protein [Lachnospiraceae bacterium]
MKNQSSKTGAGVLYIAQAGVIAAIYVVLTMAINVFNLASGAIQVRISEALCILPYFTSAAIPGLSIGCLLANLLTGAPIWDVIFGTLATLIGAIFSYMLRKHKFLVTVPPVVANMLIIPFVLYYAYGYKLAWVVGGVDLSIPFYMVTVGIGEVISVMILGTILLRALEPVKNHIFRK